MVYLGNYYYLWDCFSQKSYIAFLYTFYVYLFWIDIIFWWFFFSNFYSLQYKVYWINCKFLLLKKTFKSKYFESNTSLILVGGWTIINISYLFIHNVFQGNLISGNLTQHLKRKILLKLSNSKWAANTLHVFALSSFWFFTYFVLETGKRGPCQKCEKDLVLFSL